MSSTSLHRSSCVSWFVESPPAAAARTAAADPPQSQKAFSHHIQQSSSGGSTPVLLLSPPETSREETEATFSHQSSSAPSSHNAAISHNDEEEDDDDRENGGKKNFSPPKDKVFLLPRSSPVISRHHRPVSWDGGTDPPAASSSDSPSRPSGSLILDQCGHPTVASTEDRGSKPSSAHSSSPVQEDKKPRYISVLSNLNQLLSAGFNLPFSGQQGSTQTSDFSTSTQPGQERSSGGGFPEFPADVFKTTCDLDKENAHFIVLDMVLEVLEGAKWTLSFDQRTSMMMDSNYDEDGEAAEEQEESCDTDTHTHSCCNGGEQEADQNRLPEGDNERSHRNTHSSNTNEQDEEEEEAENKKHQPKTFSVLSTDSGFEDCGSDTMLFTHTASLNTAERLAEQLVKEFRNSWIPSDGPQRGRKSLRSSLQELPGTGVVAASSESLAEEIRLRTRMRGSLCWAPPRFQIIFTVQPSHRRNEVMALQHFLCAGCGTGVEPRYIKKLRYCEYLGRYFCDCCHSGSEAVIPGRVLSCWDFSRYTVSDFSKQLLDSVRYQPLFDLTCVGKTLYSKVKELDKFREIQEHLIGIKKLLKACRLSGRLMTELEQLPHHLTKQLHVFSMDDLFRVKKGQLVAQTRALLHSAINHVENCELCLARGFICEFCRQRHIIFPFQTDICKRCPVCKACFHKECFVEKKCPKCTRIQSRNKTF